MTPVGPRGPMIPARATLTKLRGLYHQAWSRDWPEGNDFLTELWLEARATHGAARAHVPPPEVWETTLTLMRECHEFNPTEPPS